MSKKPNKLDAYVFGKQQPQAVPLEMAVLGALMIDKDAIHEVSSRISAASFYKEAHQQVYAAILHLHNNAQPIDLLTVTEELKKRNQLKEGLTPYYLVELTNRVASSANVEYHAGIIAEKHIQREVIRVSSATLEKAYKDETDVFDLLDDYELELDKLKTDNIPDVATSISKISTAFYERLQKAKASKGLAGIKVFGITKLDTALNGAEADDLIIVAGRPAMGKSSLFNSAIINAIENNLAIAVWSIEMSKERTLGRAVAALTGIEFTRMMQGKITDAEDVQVQQALSRINNSKVIIADKPANIYQFRSQIITMKRKHGIQAVLFDRVELYTKLNGRHDDRQHLEMITPILRRTALELALPIIIISQLNRAVESRGGSKRPQLSDLRNSGSLEQDATKVVLVYRPEYYDIMETEEGESTANRGELIIVKNSNGACKTVPVAFNKPCMYFYDIPEDETIYKTVAATPAADDMPRMAEDDIPF